MALAIIVTIEKPLPETEAYTKSKTGKALARELEKLDFAARCQNVPAITALLSESHAVLRAQMEADGFDPSKMRLPPERWYSAAEGLKTVRALVEYLNSHFNDFKQPNPVLRDLKAAEALLVAADTAKVQFHFTKMNA